MNRRQKIIVSVTGIFIVLLILVGLTYAYFLTKIKGNDNEKSISVTTANLELVYGDGNALITAEKIEPGDSITAKTFTVTNSGNATINNYAVYLEELVNNLERTSDMVYTLTCTSSVTNSTCNGKTETVFPTQNGILVTNNIVKDEVQTYSLQLTYKEMNVDQSVDMGKEVSAKVQIYNLRDIVDITGTVTGASDGDYVELHSNPKKSQINNNTYTIPGVEPGSHTIYLKDKDGTVLGQKDITINKGETAGVSGTTITTTEDSQTVTINLTKTSSDFTINLDKVEDYNPFENGTLASAIYTSAKTKANGTELLSSPRSNIGSSCIYTTGKMINEEKRTIELPEAPSVWLIGDTESEAESGKVANSFEEAVGKYLYNQRGEYIEGKLIGYNSVTGILTFEKKIKETKIENVLSVSNDDYGTTYFYRGGVTDNYVDFAGMCWRIVRIAGDGSIKLILEDQDSTCASSDGNWNIPTTTGGTTKKGIYGYTDIDIDNYIYKLNYLNGETDNDKSMVTAFKNFQTGPLAKYLSYLKAGDWCLNDKAYASGTENTTPLTSDEVLNKQINGISFYYDSYIRLSQKNEPTLKCNATNMNKFIDSTEMYVGTLTADEVTFAGNGLGTNHKYNNFEYLINDYSNNNNLSFWTLSPSGFDGDIVFGAFFVHIKNEYVESGETYYSREATLDWNFPNDTISFRPSINLKSGIEISSGDGTKNNAYIIK